MYFTDRLVSYFSPKRAYERIKYRRAIEEVRKYDAASHGRRTDGWKAYSTSANAEVSISIHTLRNRSRELVRNNPYAKRALQNITTNTIGTGIRPTPIADGISKKMLANMKKAWRKWGETTVCDYNGQFNIYGLQRLVMRSATESGGVFVRIRRVSKGGIVPIKLQILESDLLDMSKSTQIIKEGEDYIIQGVAFDKDGQRKGYYFYDRHPGDSYNLESRFVPASEIMHIYYVERPGQVHGVPFGASAMLRLRDFDDYEDAQLLRQKIAACFSIFITDATGESSKKKGPMIDKLEPGLIEELPAGKTVTMASPPGAEGYGEYSKTVLRAIAAGFGTTYEAMTGDLSNVNFSSGRMGWLEFQRLIDEWQQYMMVPMFCNVVWKEFLKASAIAGTLPITVIDTDVSWTMPAREMIDPTKEIKAIIESLRAGLMSWEEAAISLGRDPEVLLQQLKNSGELFSANGLFPTSDPRFDVNRMSANKSAESTDATDSNNNDDDNTEGEASNKKETQ